MSVPRSPAVANRVPCKFSARHVTADSCAMISSGVRSVLAKSTICGCMQIRKKWNYYMIVFLVYRFHTMAYRYVTAHSRRIGENRFTTARAENAQSKGIWVCFENMQLLRFRCERKHFDEPFQYNHNAIASQANCFDRCIKIQRKRWRLVEIIPDDHFVLWIQRTNTATDQCQVIATEQHFYVTKTTFRKDVPFLLLQRVDIVYSEAIICCTRKASWNKFKHIQLIHR